MTGTCSIPDCSKPRYQQRAMCSTHVMRKHRYGDPLTDRTRTGRTWTTDNGYRKRTVGHSHPLADGKGAVAVHRLVLFEAIGEGPHSCHWCGITVDWIRFDGSSWSGVLVVDHLNDDKRDNRPDNLVASCFSCNALRARWGNDAVRKTTTTRQG